MGFYDELGIRIAQLDKALEALHQAHQSKIAELRGAGLLRGIRLAA